MEFNDIVHKRRSIRKFKTDQIEKEVIVEIIKDALTNGFKESEDYNNALFYKEINVKKNTPYKVSCYVKTENVESIILDEYKKLLYSKKADDLIDKFGLEDHERQTWDIDFFTRLFETDIRQYMENNLDKSLLKKIKINQDDS